MTIIGAIKGVCMIASAANFMHVMIKPPTLNDWTAFISAIVLGIGTIASIILQFMNRATALSTHQNTEQIKDGMTTRNIGQAAVINEQAKTIAHQEGVSEGKKQ